MRRSLQGGIAKGEAGYFIEPTLIQTDDPGYRTMCEEIFGPVVTAYVYPDAQWQQTLAVVDQTSPYALTGAIFSRDRKAVREATSALRNAAGNFYVNDKPTGAVVGQQPFGGARGSGTNDKAGSKLNLVRWVNARTREGNLHPAARVQVSVHGRGVDRKSEVTEGTEATEEVLFTFDFSLLTCRLWTTFAIP